jgi:hypothetical protein
MLVSNTYKISSSIPKTASIYVCEIAEKKVEQQLMQKPEMQMS